MYVKEHYQKWYQKVRTNSDLRATINEKQKKHFKKHYENNKEKLLADRKKYMHQNYVKCALQRIKSRCKKNGIAFDLLVDDIQLPTHCPVLGIELIIGEGRGATDNSPSFDRIIPERGYVKGNVIVVSNKANRMKNSGTIDDMKKMVIFYESL